MTDPDNWAEEDRPCGEILILAGLGMLISAFFAPFDLLNWWSDARDEARRQRSDRDAINLHDGPIVITGVERDHG
jgi:hypothetical protein